MAWFVGGELKLFMEKDRVELAGRTALRTLDRVTRAFVASPVHCTPELTFYIGYILLMIGCCRPWPLW